MNDENSTDVVKYILETFAENVLCFHIHDKLM